MVYDQTEIKYSEILKQQMAANVTSSHGGLIATANGGVNIVDEISLMKQQQQQHISVDSFGHLQAAGAEYQLATPTAEDAALDQQFLQGTHPMHAFASNAQGFSPIFGSVQSSGSLLSQTGYSSSPSDLMMPPAPSSAAAAAMFSLSSQSSCSSASFLGFPHESGKKRRRQATQAQRRAANIRERKRMLSLNDAFEELRQIVPTFSHEKKISRIDTLRLAIIYISFMTDILAGKDENDIEVRSLKHGWTSVREKLQQQMAAQQQRAVTEIAAAQQAAINQQMAVAASANDFCTLMTTPAASVLSNGYQTPATYTCGPGEFYAIDHTATQMLQY